MNGTILRLTKDRGFGFIKGEDEKEYFFHRSCCAETFEEMLEGDHVKFRATQGIKGPRAEEVNLI